MLAPLQENEHAAWDAFVEHNGGTAFHTIAWERVMEQSFGYEPYYHTLKDSRGRIIAALPLFLTRGVRGAALVSLPFVEYGGPVALPQALPQVFHGLLDLFHTLQKTRKARYMEIKTLPGIAYPAAEQIGFTKVLKAHDYVLSVRGKDFQADFWNALKATTRIRHSVRRGQRLGVRIAPGGMDHCYTLHVDTMARLGSLPWPKDFFINIQTRFPGARFMLAWLEGKPIAGLMSIPYQGRIHAMVLSSDYAYQQYRASDLLHCNEIRFAYENGFAFMDFGRTRPNTQYGRYKRKWGAEKHPLYSYVYPAYCARRVNPYALYERFSVLTRNNIVWKTLIKTRFGQNLIRYAP